MATRFVGSWITPVARVALAIACVALGACDKKGGNGKSDDLGSDAGGGNAINLTVTIVGEGSVAVNGTTSCTSATDPCVLNVVIGDTTTIAAIPANGWAFSQWSCDGAVSSSATLDFAPRSGASCTVTFVGTGVELGVTVTDGAGGTGGVVTSTPAAISCGTGATMCSALFDKNSTAMLTAVPDAFHSFVEWSGDCSGTSPSTSVVLDAAKACTATFARQQFPLVLSVVGDGTLVAATTAAVVQTCTTATCDAVTLPAETVLTLTATPGANARIVSWTGDCVADASANTTTITMTQARTCTVTFAPVDRLLTTNVVGAGAIALEPAGTVGTGGTNFPHGTEVTLTAMPSDADHAFLSWSGDCSGTDPVTTVLLDADRTCTATFGPVLEVTVIGSGSVVSSPAGIATTAGANRFFYSLGTSVQLTAAANTGGPAITFDGWSGDCASFGTSLTGSVTLDVVRKCTATFTVTPYDLTVAAAPTAGGRVVGKKNGTGANVIDCGNGGTDCAETGIASNDNVVLTATPNAATMYRFAQWSGCSTAASNPLTVAMNANKSCTATFVQQGVVSVSAGSGGTVALSSSAAAPNNCASGSPCTADGGTSITITATPGANSRFSGWSGANCNAANLNAVSTTIGVTAGLTRACTANFTATGSVSVAAGSGGSVALASSAAAPNNCASGSPCTADGGTSVTITATPGANARFSGWSGTTCNAANSNAASTTMTVTAGTARTCTASFTSTGVVAVATSTGGTVALSSSAAAPNNCASGSPCTADGGTTVTISASVSSNYRFSGWTGASCNAANANAASTTMTVTAAMTRTCTASFTATGVVAVATATGGTVSLSSSAAAPNNCASGSPCTADAGTSVTISASVGANYRFSGWSGATCNAANTNAATTTMTVTAATTRTCTASFVATGIVAVATNTGGTVSLSSSAAAPNNCASGSPCTADAGTSVTINASVTSGYRFGGWSGATCNAANASATSTTMTVTAATTRTCTATFVGRRTVTWSTPQGTISGTGTGTSPVCSATATTGSCVVDDGQNVTLTVGSIPATQQLTGWTGTGCTVATATNPLPRNNVTADQSCTATFTPVFSVTVRVVPSNNTTNQFGTVSAPCTIGSTVASCTATVAAGNAVALNATEATGPSGRRARFVKWSCSNGFTSTSLTASATNNLQANLTCVAQYYGLWARYYRANTSTINGGPQMTELAPGIGADGLPTSSVPFLSDQAGISGTTISADALVAEDNEINGPDLTSRGQPNQSFTPNRMLAGAGDLRVTIGRFTGPGTGNAARYRAGFWPFDLGRDATSKVVNSLARESFLEYAFTPPGPIGGYTFYWDSFFQNGAYRAASNRYVLGGTRGMTASVNFGGGPVYSTQDYGWVLTTDANGADFASTRFAVPASFSNGVCGTELATNVQALMWDPDPSNAGGVVVVGSYTTANNNIWGFIAKLDASLGLRAPGIQTFVPSSNANLTLNAIVPALGVSGYTIFGNYASNSIAMIRVAYDLSAPALVAIQDSLSVTSATTGQQLAVSFGDVLVEANRYVVVGALNAADSGLNYDILTMFLKEDGTPQGGIQFGTSSLYELGSRIIKPQDGGYLIGGAGYLTITTPLTAGTLLLRTDENFAVPWNGNAPSITQQSLAPTRFGVGDLKLGANAALCATSWFDAVAPTRNTVTATESSFAATAAVNIQAP